MKNKICIGTMLWGTQTSQQEANKIISTALDNDIDFFDTAQTYPTFPYNPSRYGTSETILGEWMENNKKKLCISTKLQSPVKASEIKKLVHLSLKRLKIDSIDYLHFHGPGRNHYHFRQIFNYAPEGNKQEVLDYFDKCSSILNALWAEGKIKNICMSNETAWGITEWSKRLNLYAIQNEYCLLHRLFELDVAEACYYNNVKLFAWSPLAGGLLTGKYTQDYTPNGSRRSYRGLGPRDNPNVWAPLKRYYQIAKEANLSLTQMSIAFLARNPQCEAIILGNTSSKQLINNCNELKRKINLSENVLSKIKEVYRDHPLPF
tara:strand:+ start:106 stop:1062 length:957 start_codon:yes stop_codon:yes gene_type:complete